MIVDSKDVPYKAGKTGPVRLFGKTGLTSYHFSFLITVVRPQKRFFCKTSLTNLKILGKIEWSLTKVFWSLVRPW